jgi:hypothetical protein
MLGFFGKAKLAGTPEGAIVVIVETFWRSVIRQMSANPGYDRGDDAAQQAIIRRFRNHALAAIEQHRKRFYGGVSDYPKELTEYVIYRLEREMERVHHMRLEQMALDREVIAYMVDECNDYFRARVDALR